MIRRPRRIALLVLTLLAVGCAGSTIPSVHSETERLALARRQMSQQRWLAAIELLKSYVANNPGGGDVDEAIYLLGDAYLHTKDWVSAANEFERLIRDYPESDSTASASFQLGAAQYGQSRPPDFDQEFTVKALEQWQRYLIDYPGHWRNAEAQRRIDEARSRLALKLLRTAQLYLKLHLPEPARVYFDRVVQEYGDSLLLKDAMFGLAMTYAEQGARDEAITRFKEVETRFAGQEVARQAARERSKLEHKRS